MNAVSVGMLYTGDRIAVFGLFGRVEHFITLLPTFSALMDGIDCNKSVIRITTRKTCDDNGIDFLILQLCIVDTVWIYFHGIYEKMYTTECF